MEYLAEEVMDKEEAKAVVVLVVQVVAMVMDMSMALLMEVKEELTAQVVVGQIILL